MLLLLLLASTPAAIADGQETPGQEQVCDDYDPKRTPYFGDLHVHTSFSMDTIYFGGDMSSDPAAAYRFAKGDPIGFPPFDGAGNPFFSIELERPLDFVAVTDHAEYFGELQICFEPDHPGYQSPECLAMRSGNIGAAFFTWFLPLAGPPAQSLDRFDFCDTGDENCLDVARSVWEETRAAAVAADDPTSACEFSALVGYEWTGNTAGANLHRNVIFRTETVPDLPVSYLDAPQPELLYDALEDTCLEAGTDCDALVIPHNPNFSLGAMFLPQTSDGQPFDQLSAARRAQFEPLVEIVQHKGVSECRPGFGTSDENCGFEVVSQTSLLLPPGAPGQPPASPLSYVRNALKLGLEQQEEIGVNPFKLGFVGGTDDHSAAAGSVDEGDYPGHLGVVDSVLPARLFQLANNPGGLTVIWAEQNSRESLFDALRRREVYATSGTRPTVRFFGGYQYPDAMCNGQGFVAVGYAQGVPMGGDLGQAGPSPEHQAPRFAVSALRDPGTAENPGAALDRIQIIKAWVDSNGDAQEATLDVVTAGPDGADSLCTVWQDDDFDSGAPAFYYARVLEVPTDRWHTQQCRAAQVSCDDPGSIPPGLAGCCSDAVPATIQERAWTSPIWFTPADAD